MKQTKWTDRQIEVRDEMKRSVAARIKRQKKKWPIPTPEEAAAAIAKFEADKRAEEQERTQEAA